MPARMKELDVLLTRYLESHYAGASPAAQGAFLELLEAPDPLIYAYCMGQALRRHPFSHPSSSASLPCRRLAGVGTDGDGG